MKRYYVVTSTQAFGVCIASALLSAAAVVGASAFTYASALPTVYVDETGKCTQVTSSRNGEAYQCQDRDVSLRQYRVQSPTNR